MLPTTYLRVLGSQSPAALLWILTRGSYQPNLPHIVTMSRMLARAATGTPRRLLVEAPPRHGKSELFSHAFPLWYLNRWPSRRVILACHTADLASHYGRRVRNTIIANADALSVRVSSDSSAADRWDTTEGGGLYAVGVGGAVVGRGGDVVVVDDPIKGSEAAHSKTQRDAVWTWWRDDLIPRQEPGAIYVVMHQRWHREDLAGRIIESQAGEWTRVRLPALAERDDPLGRTEGEALWPERFSREALETIRASMSPFGWAAEYQQDPQAISEGALIDREFLSTVDVLPSDAYARVRYWDCAATKEDGCYTVGLLMSRNPRGVVTIEHVVRGRWNAGDVERLIDDTAAVDGMEVDVDWEEEPGSAGISVTDSRRRRLIGYRTHGTKATGPKWVRAQPFASYARGGNVRVMSGPWTHAYVDELTSATPDLKGYMDQVDATSGAFAWVVKHASDVPKPPREDYAADFWRERLSGPHRRRVFNPFRG